MTFISPTKVLAHIDRLDQWKQGLKPAPVTIEWDLSNRCYLGCQSCHFSHTHTRGPWVTKDRRLPMAWEGTGDLASTTVVTRALTDMAYVGVKGVIWSGGGEPTTHPEWQRIVATANHLGFKQGMYTAGGLITSPEAYALRHLTWVVVSLDAIDAETYAREKGVPPLLFDRAIEGVRALVGTGPDVVGLSFLLHGRNWNRVEEMVALGRSLGVTYVTFRPTIDTQAHDPATISADRAWITQALPMLEQAAREPDVECDPARFEAYRDWSDRRYTTCHGIKLNTTVTPDGKVWVCPQRRGLKDSFVGDLSTDSFAALWQRHPGEWTDFSGNGRALNVRCASG